MEWHEMEKICVECQTVHGILMFDFTGEFDSLPPFLFVIVVEYLIVRRMIFGVIIFNDTKKKTNEEK